MVAAGAVLLGVGCTAELAAPPDDRIVEQAALLEIGEQAGDRFIDGLRVVAVLWQVGVLIPGGVGAAVAIGDLHVAHAGFAQASGHQALSAIAVRRFLADAVHFLRRGRFLRDVENIGRVVLHLPAEFV